MKTSFKSIYLFTLLLVIFSISACNRLSILELEGNNYKLKIEKEIGGKTNVFVMLHDNVVTHLTTGPKSTLDIIWSNNKESENNELAVLILEVNTDYTIEIKNKNIHIYDLSDSKVFYETYFKNQNSLEEGLKKGFQRKMIHLEYY